MGKFNPFNPNSVVIPSLFAGRTEQVLQILNKLSYVRKGMSSSFVLSVAAKKFCLSICVMENMTKEMLHEDGHGDYKITSECA